MSTNKTPATETPLPRIAVECFDYIRAEIRHQRRVVADAPAYMRDALTAMEGVPASELEEQCMAWVHGRGVPYSEGLQGAPVARLIRAGLLVEEVTPRAKGPSFRMYKLAPGLQP